jgi:hypothetical protein
MDFFCKVEVNGKYLLLCKTIKKCINLWILPCFSENVVCWISLILLSIILVVVDGEFKFEEEDLLIVDGESIGSEEEVE